MKLIYAIAAVTICAAPLQSQQSPAASDSLALARRWTKLFYESKLDSLILYVPQGSRTELAREFSNYAEMMRSRAGTEISIVEERFIRRNGNRQYWRTANFSNAPEPLLLRWVVSASGELMGIGLGPLSQAPPIDK
jgi:hypothetical protein